MGCVLLAREGRFRDGLHRAWIVEGDVDERRLVVGGHRDAAERRRDISVGSGVDLRDPVEEVLPVAVRPADCGEHAPQVCVDALKVVQLGWPCGRLCRRSVRQGEQWARGHGTVGDVGKGDRHAALAVGCYAGHGRGDGKVDVTVGDLVDGEPGGELVIDAGLEAEHRAGDHRQPRSAKHEERVRIEPEVGVQRGAEAGGRGDDRVTGRL